MKHKFLLFGVYFSSFWCHVVLFSLKVTRVRPAAIFYTRYLYNKNKTAHEKGEHKLVKLQRIDENGLVE